jgi:hypothetical protein
MCPQKWKMRTDILSSSQVLEQCWVNSAVLCHPQTYPGHSTVCFVHIWNKSPYMKQQMFSIVRLKEVIWRGVRYSAKLGPISLLRPCSLAAEPPSPQVPSAIDSTLHHPFAAIVWTLYILCVDLLPESLRLCLALQSPPGITSAHHLSDSHHILSCRLLACVPKIYIKA